LRVMLTIAGFDPSSGAGVTADLAVFRAEGFFGTACVTALTVQSTVGVERVEAVQPALVADMLRCVEEDLPADGIKIGMLASAENVEAVTAFLRVRREAGRAGDGRPGASTPEAEKRCPVVLDPVLGSSSGRPLLSMAGVRALERLLPEVSWVTPNLSELAVLTGLPVGTRSEREAGAAQLQARHPGLGVIVTGGHLTGGNKVADLVLAPGARPAWLEGDRVESRATHGTGCVYSSMLACGLTRGLSGPEAAGVAQRWVASAIRSAVPLGSGYGPMNLSGTAG
jgi:hydroxymethylpyrimidine/phosphomethylpyrimidine kinase